MAQNEPKTAQIIDLANKIRMETYVSYNMHVIYTILMI